MVLRRGITLIAFWIVSLIIVAAIARAQTPPQRGATPTIISGSDLGFRVDRQRADRVYGTLLVRINGEWVVAEPPTGLKPLGGK
jgi:hypothetical protein